MKLMEGGMIAMASGLASVERVRRPRLGIRFHSDGNRDDRSIQPTTGREDARAPEAFELPGRLAHEA